MKTRKQGWKALAIIGLCAVMAACAGGKGNDGAPSASGAGASAAPEAAADGTTVVTMSVMTKDRFLAEAEQKFEAAHPNIDIQINELVPADTNGDKMMVRKGPGSDSGPKPEDIEKYTNSVNTAIMSGKASDLIAVEYLPVDKYAEKGLLADWNEQAGSDGSFNKSDYYGNVLNGVSYDGGWYGIPASFSLDVMLGEVPLLEQNSLDDKTWTWAQFVDLLEKTRTEGKYGIAMMTPEQLLSFLVESVYGQLVTKNGNAASFDAGAFQAYLENIKKLYDQGLATKDGMGPDTASFTHNEMSSPMDAALIPQMGGGSKTMLQPPGTGQDEGISFKSGLVLGLNAQSKVKEAAWSFVQFLLSEEMQSSNALMNFPVNKAAVTNKLVETQKILDGQGGGGRQIMMRGPDGEEIHPTLSDEDIRKVEELMGSVGKYSNQDPKVLNMISEESAAYFNGSKSSEAVAKSLAGRIGTYLNE